MQQCRIIYCSLAALHLSSDTFAHHQEHLKCIKHVSCCRPATTHVHNTRGCKYSLDTPDDEQKYHSKDVKQPRNNKLSYTVASCWSYSYIISWCTEPWLSRKANLPGTTRQIDFWIWWGTGGSLHVPVVVILERQCVRGHKAAQLVFRAESHRVGTYFPWDYLTCFLLTKELLGKHLD